MTHRQNETVLDAVLRDAAVRKIVLRRQNRVRTFVSQRISEELDQWEVYREADLASDRPRVHVDVAALRESIADNEAYYDEIERVLDAAGNRISAFRTNVSSRAASEHACSSSSASQTLRARRRCSACAASGRTRLPSAS